MSATDELRAMLDERGVEWGNVRNDGSESDYLTEWQFENNQGKAIATEWAVGSGLSVEIHRYHLAPEQAVEATLGRGECTLEKVCDGYLYFRVHECNECGTRFAYRAIRSGKNARPKFCPNCGAKVVDE